MRRLSLLILTALTLLAVAPWPGVAAAQSTRQSTAPSAPTAATRELQSALFDAQDALIMEDASAAAAALAAAEPAAITAGAGFTATPELAAALTTHLAAAEAAVAANDARALSLAHGQLRGTVLRGAYAQTMAAVTAGDADAAASWLLIRDFRPTTRFARPNADATLAVQALGAGQLSPEAAVAAVSADLLDTYQARIESSLGALADTPPAALSLNQAYLAGLAAGIWPVLAPAYATQFGVDAATAAEAAFAGLTTAITSSATGDAVDDSLAAPLAATTEIIESFRAAPLSEADQARRSGQLLRYLSLVSVEYGRGVKRGEVIADFEITEAQAFLEGARASFADLRLALQGINPGETAAVAAALAQLDHDLAAAKDRTAVASPETIKALTDDTAGRLGALYPAAWSAAGGDADFDVVDDLLDQMVAAVAAGEYQQADSARLEAYAIFETGPEKRLMAFAPSAVQQVERLFWDGNGTTPGLHALLSDRADVKTVQTAANNLKTELADAKATLSGGTAPAAIVFNAATIVFREGLEAVLILASLMASMIGANRRFKAPLAIGAIGALAATVLLFVLARMALLSFDAYAEQIEAIVSVIAIGVLLLVMNWFFHKVYWTRWIAGHHERRRQLVIGGIAGQTLGLVVLGFTSVFREGAETVLFLQALVLDAGTGIVVQGTLLGLLATAIVGVLTLVLQTKLPHKKMLIVTGFMIALVLVTMVGTTVHTLQLVGWLPIHAIQPLEGLPYWLGVWFGVYPTWEGLAAQFVAIVFVFGSYVLAEQTQRRGGVRAVITRASVAGTS